MNSDREELNGYIQYTDRCILDSIDVMREGIPSQTYSFDDEKWEFYVGTGEHFFAPGTRINIPEPLTHESRAVRHKINTTKQLEPSFPAKLLYKFSTDGFLDPGYVRNEGSPSCITRCNYKDTWATGLAEANRLRYVVRYGTRVVIYECKETDFTFDAAIAWSKRNNRFLPKNDFLRIFKPAPIITNNFNSNVLTFLMVNTGS